MDCEKIDNPKVIYQTECSICLETLCYPAKLPCDHVFCYLCIKGFLNTQNSRCALCRMEVPPNYLLNPNLLLDENNFENSNIKIIKSGMGASNVDSLQNQDADMYVWYYEVNNFL